MEAKTTVIPDIRNVILNGDFSAWTDDNPDDWEKTGESPPIREVSEVGAGEGHGGSGTGLCNLYTSDGDIIQIFQTVTLVVGKKYKVSINIDTVIAGGVLFFDYPTAMFDSQEYTTTGVKSFTFIATGTALALYIQRLTDEPTDVTIDDVSIKPVRQALPL